MERTVIEWNSSDCFIGKFELDSELLSDFNFDTFLVTPYVAELSGKETNGARSVKFSGQRDFAKNDDPELGPYGPAMDAFAHHVVQHSNETLLLSDLQGEYDLIG